MARFDDQAFRLQNKSTEKAFEDENVQMGALPDGLNSKELLKTYEGYEKYDTAVENAKKFRQKKSSMIAVVIVLIVLAVVGILAFVFRGTIGGTNIDSSSSSEEILSSATSSESVSSSASSNVSSASSSKETSSVTSSKSSASSNTSSRSTESIPGVVSLSNDGYSINLLSIISAADLPSTGAVSANTLELANEEGDYGTNQKLIITSNSGKDFFVVGRFYAFSSEDASTASKWIQANVLEDSATEPVEVYSDNTVAIFFVTEEDGKALDTRVKADQTLSSSQEYIDALYKAIQENGSDYITVSTSSRVRSASSSASSKTNSSSASSSRSSSSSSKSSSTSSATSSNTSSRSSSR